MNGEKLREYRETLGLSQAKLAELSSIPQYLLSSFELGKQELTKELINQIKETLSNEKKTRDSN